MKKIITYFADVKSILTDIANCLYRIMFKIDDLCKLIDSVTIQNDNVNDTKN